MVKNAYSTIRTVTAKMIALVLLRIEASAIKIKTHRSLELHTQGSGFFVLVQYTQ